MKKLIAAIVTLVFSFAIAPSSAFAQEEDVTYKARPKIGLVLGGGGAKGLAHVGVIKVLEENHIPVDVVSGTSMGAVVGSLYASGFTTEDLLDVAYTMDWADVFDDNTSRSNTTFRRKADQFGFLTDYKITFRDGKIVLPQGIIQGQNLFLELSRMLAHTRSIGRFEELPIPFRLVATDLGTGEPVVMTDGDLATAVFASMAIPGFLPPVEREGKYLIDGGIANNVPVNLARQLGADVVIVVNVGTEPKPPEEITNFIEVMRQTQILLSIDNTKFQLSTMKRGDVLIEPATASISIAGFDHAGDAVKIGEAAARAMLPKLLPYQLNDEDWAVHIKARTSAPGESHVIDRIEIVQNSKLSDEIIRTGISIQPGETLDPARLNRDIDRIYGDGIFSRITYKVIEDGPKKTLQISANAREASDGYFKFGVALDSNLENESDFKLGVSYTKPQLNKWGGEWRAEINIGDTVEGVTEFYQPIGAKQRMFIEPSLFLQRDKDGFFDGLDRRRGDIKTLAFGGSLQGGYLLGRWGEVRVGATTARVRIDLTDESLGIDPFNIDDSSLLARFTVDTVDSLSFPTRGTLVIAEYQLHDDTLGGDTQYRQTSLNAFKPFTAGRHTFGLGTRLAGSTGRDAGLVGTTNLGGFLALSGFSEDELSGQYAAMALGTYYYRLNQKAALFDAPIYIGTSLEYGNVYQSFDAISINNGILASSIFAGVKSPLGPIFIGAGYNDKGNASFYFSIGSFF